MNHIETVETGRVNLRELEQAAEELLRTIYVQLYSLLEGEDRKRIAREQTVRAMKKINELTAPSINF